MDGTDDLTGVDRAGRVDVVVEIILRDSTEAVMVGAMIVVVTTVD